MNLYEQVSLPCLTGGLKISEKISFNRSQKVPRKLKRKVFDYIWTNIWIFQKKYVRSERASFIRWFLLESSLLSPLELLYYHYKIGSRLNLTRKYALCAKIKGGSHNYWALARQNYAFRNVPKGEVFSKRIIL